MRLLVDKVPETASICDSHGYFWMVEVLPWKTLLVDYRTCNSSPVRVGQSYCKLADENSTNECLESDSAKQILQGVSCFPLKPSLHFKEMALVDKLHKIINAPYTSLRWSTIYG